MMYFAAGIEGKVDIVKDGHLLQLSSFVVLKTTSAMFGDYQTQGSLWADNEAPSLNGKIRFDGATIQVMNTPAQADVEGPEVQAMSLAPVVKVGSKLSFVVTLKDKSDICVTGTENGICDPESTLVFVRDLLLTNDEHDGYAVWPADVVLTGNNRYRVTTKDKLNVVSSFSVEGMAIFDVWGNRNVTSPSGYFKVMP